MAIKIGSNFTFQGKQPNFERDRFATKDAMKAFPETSIDDGHLSYCADDGNTYQFKSSNTVDAVTGKWRVFKADVDLSAYVTKDSVATYLAKKVDISGKSYPKPGSSADFGILKIVTIVVPEIIYQTGFLGLTLMCREEQLIKVLITINTTNVPTKIKVIESSSKPHLKEPLHYLYDTTNRIFTLYYTIAPYDCVTAKVTDKDNQMDFTYNLDLTEVDALPEGAIQVHNVNYGNKNLFYATPKDAAGDPTFRAIDITDLPDLSSKYQAVNSNGYQPNPLMINARVGADSNSGYKYLTALTYGLPDNIPYKASPDWYFATDGTLQDIKTKIPKVVLDDAVSTTSDNGVKNSVITQYVDSKVTVINDSIADVRTSLDSTQTDFVDLREKVKAMPKTVFITQAAYDALITKDPNTIYYING